MKNSISISTRKSAFAVCSLLMVLTVSSCKPSVDTDIWENGIRPEMESHKVYLMIQEQLSEYCFTEMDVNMIDPSPESHIVDAIDYVEAYIADSLDSYSDIRYLYDVLSQKDEAGELNLEDGFEEQVAKAWLGALGISLGDWTKEYALKIAQYIQDEFEDISVEMDTPEYVRKTTDRITYSVYCPTYNETYTLTCDRNSGDFSWDLTPIELSTSK